MIEKLVAGIAIGVALSVSVSVSAASGQEFIMKFGTASVNDPQTAYLRMYKEELEKRTNGRIRVDLYPQSQLGAIARQIEGVQLGTVEAFIAPVDFFVGIDQRFGVFSTPMLFRDEKHAEAAIHDPALEKSLLSLAEPRGMIGIGAVTLGVANYAARTPIARLSDFKGKKIRINGTQLERVKMSRLGATGIAMPLSEVSPALSQGAIDGAISIMSVFVSFKMSDLVKVVTITNDTMIISIAVVSKAWYAKLPPDLQKAVVESGAAIREKLATWVVEFNSSQAEAWKKIGGEIVTLPKEDLESLKAQLINVGDEVTNGQPQVHEMLEQVRAAAKKY